MSFVKKCLNCLLVLGMCGANGGLAAGESSKVVANSSLSRFSVDDGSGAKDEVKNFFDNCGQYSPEEISKINFKVKNEQQEGENLSYTIEGYGLDELKMSDGTPFTFRINRNIKFDNLDDDKINFDYNFSIVFDGKSKEDFEVFGKVVKSNRIFNILVRDLILSVSHNSSLESKLVSKFSDMLLLGGDEHLEIRFSDVSLSDTNGRIVLNGNVVEKGKVDIQDSKKDKVIEISDNVSKPDENVSKSATSVEIKSEENKKDDTQSPAEVKASGETTSEAGTIEEVKPVEDKKDKAQSPTEVKTPGETVSEISTGKEVKPVEDKKDETQSSTEVKTSGETTSESSTSEEVKPVEDKKDDTQSSTEVKTPGEIASESSTNEEIKPVEDKKDETQSSTEMKTPGETASEVSISEEVKPVEDKKDETQSSTEIKTPGETTSEASTSEEVKPVEDKKDETQSPAEIKTPGETTSEASTSKEVKPVEDKKDETQSPTEIKTPGEIASESSTSEEVKPVEDKKDETKVDDSKDEVKPLTEEQQNAEKIDTKDANVGEQEASVQSGKKLTRKQLIKNFVNKRYPGPEHEGEREFAEVLLSSMFWGDSGTDFE